MLAFFFFNNRTGPTLECQCAKCCSLTLTRIIHPVALTLSRCSVIFQMLSLVAAQFSSALGRGQHSSPAAFDPGFLTQPPVSSPETTDTPFDPRTLLRVLAEAHAAAGSQQMFKQGWQTGSSLSQGRLCRLHQGGPSLLLITAGGWRRGRSLCCLQGAQALAFHLAELRAY